jgi:arginase
MPPFVCIGAPYFLGQSREDRTDVAIVRASGFASEIGAAWIDMLPDYASTPDPITAVNRAVVQAIRSCADCFPLIFASDCTIALGAVGGLLDDEGLGVVWLDAHGDFNTPDTSPSGFVGGMPLAMLAGRGDQQYMQGVGLPPLDEGDFILTDARDLDPGEAITLKNSRVRHLRHLRDLLTAPLPDKPLYLHVDLDVIDPADMPAMGYPTPGGPALAEVAEVVRRVAREGRVIGALFALWNGSRAADDRPLASTLTVVRALIDGLHERGA